MKFSEYYNLRLSVQIREEFSIKKPEREFDMGAV
jgi:hypothetical protein